MSKKLRHRFDMKSNYKWIEIDPQSPYLFRVLLISASYTLFGMLSLVLAAKYGYAATIFPSSGIALGFLCIFGYTALAGIYIGSFILNTWIVGAITVTGLVQATIIALGATGQALIGILLIRRFVGQQISLDRERSSITFLCIAICSSIVSPSIATEVLYMTKTLDGSDVVLNWVNWFVGDAVGAITVAPLIIIVSNKRNVFWYSRMITIGLTTGIAVVLLGSLYYQVSRWDQARVRDDVKSLSNQIVQVIHDHLVGHLDVVFSIKAYFRANAKRGVTFREYDEFLRGFESKFPGIQALEFVPRVTNSDRVSFEAKIRAEGYKEFTVRESGADGKMVAVGNRPAYFPVTYVFPLQGNERAVGFDLASNPARLAAMKASATLDRQVATAKIILVQDKDKGAGFLVFDPLYVENSAQSPQRFCIDNVYGFALGVFKVKALVDGALSVVSHSDVSVNILQVGDDLKNDAIYESSPAIKLDESGAYNSLMNIEVAGQKWIIIITPTKKFVSEKRSNQGWWVLLLGLAGIGILEVLLLGVTGRAAAVERLVENRTEELDSAQKTLRTILDTTGDAIYGTDLDGQCTFCNRACLELLGYSDEGELIGRNMHNLIHHTKSDGTPLPISECQIYRAFRDSRPVHVDDEVLWRRDGTSFQSEYWSNPKIQDGHVVGAVVSFIDITKRKDTEAALISAMREAKAASIAKSDFLSNMSHEIRTPMNGVIGLSQLLLKTNLDAQQRDYLMKITASGRHLVSIINDILDFSKIESGGLTLESDNFLIDAVIDNVANLTAMSAAQKGLELVFAIAPEIPLTLRGDALRLGQIIINLVSNAVKFTHDGEIILELSLAEHLNTAVRIMCSVTDTGIGLTEAQQATLFRTFSQADTSTTRQYGGTGLGLALCKRLCELMDGTISVSSIPGRGSTFTFTVTLGISDDRRSAVEIVAPQFEGLSALVVQANPVMREALVATLEALSIRTKPVASPLDALEELGLAKEADEPVDLVILDERMPDLDGLEAAQVILGDPTFDPFPRIFLTIGFGRTEFSSQAKQIGITATLDKPIGRLHLIDTIASAFSRTVVLPVKRKPVSSTRPHVRLTHTRVLLAEDNEINREIALALLSSIGVQADIAENGRLAVDRVRSNPGRYGAVLMDIQMPEMDGIEACRRIRTFIDADNLPIIAMTAHALYQERNRCLDAGMNDHISKPIDVEDLIISLNNCIKNAHIESETQLLDSFQGTDDVALPDDLPPFGISDALIRLNGNRGLLRSLLIMFRTRYLLSPQELLRLYDDCDTQALFRLAHTLKGVAGSLEAHDAFRAAQALETSLQKNSSADIKNLVIGLADCIQTALDAANGIDNSNTKGTPL